MVRIPTLRFLGFTCLCLPIFARAVSAVAKDSDLICSKVDPKDCYPKIFEPTKDFQIIKEGQDIPPGLHVRLNIYTGLREARLNIPVEGEEDDTVEALPFEQAMVVVEQPTSEEIEAESIQDTTNSPPPIPKKAPAYDAAGKVTPPPPGADDMTTFQKAILVIQMDARAIDSALDDLLDLSHDIYYGVEIAKDGPVLERLVCFTLGLGTDRTSAVEKSRDRKAASILSSALQNNPNALKEIGDFFSLVTHPTCNTETAEDGKKTDFVNRLRSRLGKERDPPALRAKISALSGLLKEPRIRTDFLEKGVMELLLAIFLKKGEQWDIVKERVGQLVMDNFLDEGMGAELGVWPTKGLRYWGDEERSCEMKGRMLEDACWEYHVEKFWKSWGQPEWASGFLEAMKVQRDRNLRGEGEGAYDRGL